MSEPHVTDSVLPFVLERPGVRGRLVRMGPVIEKILTQHDHQEPVAQLLGEMLVMTCALSSLLKYDGVFTVQTKGDGPVGMCVSDMTTDGGLRGYIQADAEALAKLLAQAPDGWPGARELFGDGHIAFTVDQGPDTERYQGIVELAGERVAEFLQHYFRQSEQLKTGVVLAAGRHDGTWRGGALLLQEMPEEGPQNDEPLGNDQEDSWRRSQVLLSTLSDAELLDPAVTDEALLYRLFHEERVRVFKPRPLYLGCRCSRGRIEEILRSLPRDEVMAMKLDGEIVMTCQFCNIDFRFDEASLEAIYAA
ncbi:MAG: Hsp33 family molecular chaperone HslO [Pseudomonadota bacterium]